MAQLCAAADVAQLQNDVLMVVQYINAPTPMITNNCYNCTHTASTSSKSNR